jgi:hypothetical protein
MKLRKRLLICLAALLVLVGIGRFSARLAAVGFGKTVVSAFSVLSKSGFADTADLRKFFNDPELTKYANRAKALSFLGGGYAQRISDLQTGMIYCSEQLSLPPPDRFAAPPSLKYLHIESSDHTDEGVVNATSELILTFFSRL